MLPAISRRDRHGNVVDTTRPVLSPQKDVIVKVQDSLSEAVVE